MADPVVVPSDLVCRGNFRCDSFAPPNASIGDAAWDSSSPLSAENQQHQYTKQYAQANGSAVVSERKVIHVAQGASGTVKNFVIGVVTPAVGAATVVVQLLKNGVNVLSATLQITSANTAFQLVPGVFSSRTYTVGDVFEVSVTATAGGGTLPQGLFISFIGQELAE